MSKAAFKEHCWGLAFVSPPFIGFCIFMAFPIVFAFVASLTKWNGMNQMLDNFVGLDNYIKLLGDEKFWKVLLNTVIYMIGIPVGMILALVIAVGMNRKIKGIKILRTLYYVPVVSSLVAVAILWMWVFNYDYGLLNSIIKAVTGAHGPNWLGDEFWVKVSMIIFMVWKGLGGSIILYLAGLQSIPRDYYEAAKIDGCGYFKMYYKIFLPLMKGALMTQIILWFMGIWNDYLAPTIFIQDEQWFTLQVVIRSFNAYYAVNSDYPLIMAASVLAILPTLLLFFFFQRYIIESMAVTGVKG